MYCEIINKENLIEKVNNQLFQLREDLIGKGYSEEEADNSIAGSLPNCIARALIILNRGQQLP